MAMRPRPPKTQTTARASRGKEEMQESPRRSKKQRMPKSPRKPKRPSLPGRPGWPKRPKRLKTRKTARILRIQNVPKGATRTPRRQSSLPSRRSWFPAWATLRRCRSAWRTSGTSCGFGSSRPSRSGKSDRSACGLLAARRREEKLTTSPTTLPPSGSSSDRVASTVQRAALARASSPASTGARTPSRTRTTPSSLCVPTI
mmetsp:Transcript_38411/g.89098  ORF Transcript_38411/g.89098 Transcript_38411/m.89098 type:complete len:201 (+) Transcript_38411:218-820(+)